MYLKIANKLLILQSVCDGCRLQDTSYRFRSQLCNNLQLETCNLKQAGAHSSDGPEKQSKYCLLCFSRILDPAPRDRD